MANENRKIKGDKLNNNQAEKRIMVRKSDPINFKRKLYESKK